MKTKKLFLLMSAIAALASCTTDDCDHITVIDRGEKFTYEYVSSGTGSWYEEAENEEFRCTINGKFYDKYSNLRLAGETEGTYQIGDNGTRLTEYYKFMGQNQTADWKVNPENVKELSFEISSTQLGTHTYEKVVEAYTLSIGQQQQIRFASDYPAYSVTAYSSNNERIASVDNNGYITAAGEKGTTYIKVATNDGNAWVKVIVGDDFNDLWYDYSSILGTNYSIIRSQLGAPDQTGQDSENSIYSYNLATLHDYLNYINIYSDRTTQRVSQIDLHLKESVPEDVVTEYLDARYFYMTTIDTQRHYSSCSAIEDSWSALAYDTADRAIIIMTGERYMELTGGIKTSMFPQLSSVFGMWPVEVATEMRKNGFSYLRSTDEVYSFNGTDTYLVAGFENIKEVEFVYNSDNVVSQYWLYVAEDVDQLEIYHYLNENYNEAKEEEMSGYGFIYFNQEKTLKVHYKLWENAVVFTDLTLKAFDQVILRNFWKGLGMTRNELIATFGTPDRDREDDGGNVRYVGLYDYIINCDFIFDSTLGIYRQVQIYLREGVAQEVVKGYLNRLYTFYETSFADGAEVLRWVNSSNPADVNMRISYYPDYGVVVYGQFTVPVPPPFDYSKFLRKTKSEVKDMMTGKSLASESDSRILYLLDNDDYGVMVRFDFSGDTVEKAILWLRDDASPSAIKDALGAYYNFTDEGNGYTNYYSNDEKTRVLYQEDIKVIQFIARN